MGTKIVLIIFFLGLVVAAKSLARALRKYPRATAAFVFLVMYVVIVTHVPAQAQVLKQGDLKNPVTLHVFAFVKKGDGCTHVTKRAGYPLTTEQCRELLESFGRISPVDTRNPMMQIIMDPIIYPGEAFVYISTPNGKGWAFQPLRDD